MSALVKWVAGEGEAMVHGSAIMDHIPRVGDEVALEGDRVRLVEGVRWVMGETQGRGLRVVEVRLI